MALFTFKSQVYRLGIIIWSKRDLSISLKNMFIVAPEITAE